MTNFEAPARLRAGDEIRVIAPSRSLAMIGHDIREVASERFAELGFNLSFGRHVEETNEFVSTSIEHRVADLHEAFCDTAVKAVLTVIGGHNANQLLPYADWEMIEANPKIFCGYSDITALSCAIHAKTGLVTYSGPHYSTFGMQEHFGQTLNWFTAAVTSDEPVVVGPAETWSDDAWFADQHNRTIRPNEGYWVMATGQADGPLIGGNLCTFNLLHGTEYMPDLADTIVFIEDDFESHPDTFDRDLTSLTQQPGFDGVKGLFVGRFQEQVGMTRRKLELILASKRELDAVPIVANVDFGHTDPILTLPVGGRATVQSTPGSATNNVLRIYT